MEQSSEFKKACEVIRLLQEAGATDCLFVGGYVRDRILGLPSKDIDIEIYGLSYNKIIKILKPHFHVGLVGQSFSTVKVDNLIDLNIPRLETKSGVGHRGFDVSADPYLDPYSAFARRDFTINAIGMRLDGEYYDPFGGIPDIQKGILRAPTEAFCEDPLRVLRGMQFVARFGFEMDSRTIELCRRVRSEFDTLSAERVWGEWLKWATTGKYPSKGLELLRQTGWISHFPELEALIHVPQNPKYHPEGDAFTHTKMVCDAAVEVANDMNFDRNDRTILLFAALCHDFGKVHATHQNEQGNWVAPRHAAEGVDPATEFLSRMKPPNWIIEHVCPLVREHLAQRMDPQEPIPNDSLVRRLSVRLTPSSIRMWIALGRADSLGCGASETKSQLDSWEQVAEKLHVREKKPKAILQGRDLIKLGFQPGPAMGPVLQNAYEAQLDGVFDSLEKAVQFVIEHHPTKPKK